MLIGGLQKTTLIDFPGRVACTVFTIGCNFRCPFCHNRDLVIFELFEKSGIKNISEKDFWGFLESRKKVLDGVCITGGEPTLQIDLVDFCKKIKELGLEVKLDTNGSRPEVLEKLLNNKLVDYVAMDLKGVLEDYKKIVGVGMETDKIKRSMELILESGLKYCFRTTIVDGLHDERALKRLAEEIKLIGKSKKVSPKKIVWLLQNFRPQNCLDEKYLKKKSFEPEELEKFIRGLRKIIPEVRIS